jgi:methylenetetrahydrofolate dehydrogenase (NADP+)/methenyltetrahydrofolate cyclohydrolase
MSANLIDGKTLANKVKESLQNDIKRLGNDRGIVPGLTVILVGNDPASFQYPS